MMKTFNVQLANGQRMEVQADWWNVDRAGALVFFLHDYSASLPTAAIAPGVWALVTNPK